MSDLRDRLDRELSSTIPAPDARGAITRRAELRKRRRRLVLIPATLLVTATILAGLTYAFRTEPSPPGRDRVTPADDRVSREACEQGPWIKHCPEAGWARSVATTAGMDILDERGVLIIGPPDGGQFGFWAMDPALHSEVEPLPVEIQDSTMVQAGTVDSVPIYASMDGDKFVWSVHGLNVWVAEEIIGSPPPRSVIAALVRASSSLPYESGEGSVGVCDFPPLRPTYLPWLAAGQPVPEPETSLSADGGGPQGLDPGYAILSWGNGDVTRPGSDPDVSSVALWRATQSVGSFPVDPDVRPLPDGSTGRLYASEGGGGDWSIVWGDPIPDVTDDDCSETSLVVSFPNLTRSEARQEILRIAGSLVSAGAGPPMGSDPLVIHITAPRVEDGTTLNPRFQASYLGTQIPLDSIETPGSELEYPATESPVTLPAGTSIIIEGEYRVATVFELRHFRGDYIEDGACLVPTPLSQIPDRNGPSAFFIYVEWSDSSAGEAFQADVVGGGEASSAVDDPETRSDEALFGLVACAETG